MAEMKQGVQVNGTSETGDPFHPNGRAIRVDEGHLYVLDGPATVGNVIAAYAPGRWIMAQVDPSE